jgi:hypothetical protein
MFVMWAMFKKPTVAGKFLSAKDLFLEIDAGEDWMGVYYQGSKIGYMSTSIKPISDTIRLEQTSKMTVKVGQTRQKVQSRLLAHIEKGLVLKNFDFELITNLVSTRIKGRVEHGKIVSEIIIGDQQMKKSWAISEPPLLGFMVPKLLAKQDLDIKKRFVINSFDPRAFSNQPTEVEVVSVDAMDVDGMLVPAFHLRSQSALSQVDSWIDNQGNVLKEVHANGLVLKRETKEQAVLHIRQDIEADLFLKNDKTKEGIWNSLLFDVPAAGNQHDKN